MNTPLRFGILGCAKIVEHALVNPSRNCDAVELYAIASRHPVHALTFAEKHAIPFALQSYNEVIAHPDIDCIYIALPNNLHVEWARKAAEMNKHILVEKPLGIDGKNLINLADVCMKQRVFLLEGLMVQHHPWQTAIKKVVEHGIFGKLCRTKTHLSFLPRYTLSENYRSKPKQGGGSFYDLSPYWFQFIQRIKGFSMAKTKGFSTFNGPHSCDMTFTASLTYPDGLLCELETSFEKPYRARHTLIFDNAIVTIHDIFRANTGRFKIAVTIEHIHNKKNETIYFPPSNYYENQLHFFSDVIHGKQVNIPVEDSIERIQLMHTIYNQALYSNDWSNEHEIQYSYSNI